MGTWHHGWARCVLPVLEPVPQGHGVTAGLGASPRSPVIELVPWGHGVTAGLGASPWRWSQSHGDMASWLGLAHLAGV